MNRALIILIAFCALTSASVTTKKPSTEGEPQICAPQTPCAWSIYKPGLKIIEVNVSNTYCVCKRGLFVSYMKMTKPRMPMFTAVGSSEKLLVHQRASKHSRLEKCHGDG